MVTIARHEVDLDETEGTIYFDVIGAGEDLYGNPVEVDAFTLSYSMEDLKRVNWTNFDGHKLLNLGAIVKASPAGKKLIADYCAGNEDESDMFCTSADQLQ